MFKFMERGGKLPEALKCIVQVKVSLCRAEGKSTTAEQIAIDAIHEYSGHRDYEPSRINDHYKMAVTEAQRLLKRKQHNEPLRVSDSKPRGSPVRLKYLAASIPFGRELRKGLWGTTAPLVPASDSKSLWQALEKVRQWTADSPKVKLYRETALIEVEPKAPEVRSQDKRELLEPVSLSRVTKPLPYTRRAYDLTFAAEKLREGRSGARKDEWWELEEAAVYLTTGVYLASGLPRYVAEGSSHIVGDQSRGYISITVQDIESVSPQEIAGVYGWIRGRLAGSHLPEIQMTVGPNLKYHTEVMAQIELELILAEAYQRFERGESVRPHKWDWRPKPAVLLEAWKERAAEYKLEEDLFDASQEIISFRKRVPRSMYLPAFAHLRTPEDIAEEKGQVEAL